MLIRLLCLLGLFAGGAAAQEAALQSLQTGDAARGWEAVGRLDIDGKGFCTGALVAEDLVVTAAHCLYDTDSGTLIDPTRFQFLAGLRNGRALAYRGVRRALHLPDYVHGGAAEMANVGRDLALLELDQPIRSTRIVPFETGHHPRAGEAVGVVSYAIDRAEAPSLQEMCGVLGEQAGVIVMACSVDFGSSGAPVFTLAGGRARIVSLVSAKAEIEQGRVALGLALDAPLAQLRAEMARGAGQYGGIARSQIRVVRPGEGSGSDTGAKFVRP
ncbi:trypsin domain protein [Oceanicola granulosus HTCC2516]|uniref:Trypsin domain protein n=1 Tax=Oceanicola granulosus (strain ATCC BAA-861 / DSM 15982 / KCTC 12143 / HTCC2516) TaxID=314256 RepID=Q2CB59_OCEGH|nr:trypsin-like peptidase domain-containing protein [Oceanicola granulosus]EAR49926.1 trypsin domain protein [Oceanicola granulosus HTCC2516]